MAANWWYKELKSGGEKHPSLSEIYEVVLISRCQGFDSQTVSQSWTRTLRPTQPLTRPTRPTRPTIRVFREFSESNPFLGHILSRGPPFAWMISFIYCLQPFQAIGSDSLTCLMNIWFDSLGFAAREPENRTKWRGGLMPAWWFQTCSKQTWNVFFCISLSHLPVNVVNPINHP